MTFLMLFFVLQSMTACNQWCPWPTFSLCWQLNRFAALDVFVVIVENIVCGQLSLTERGRCMLFLFVAAWKQHEMGLHFFGKIAVWSTCICCMQNKRKCMEQEAVLFCQFVTCGWACLASKFKVAGPGLHCPKLVMCNLWLAFNSFMTLNGQLHTIVSTIEAMHRLTQVLSKQLFIVLEKSFSVLMFVWVGLPHWQASDKCLFPEEIEKGLFVHCLCHCCFQQLSNWANLSTDWLFDWKTSCLAG